MLPRRFRASASMVSSMLTHFEVLDPATIGEFVPCALKSPSSTSESTIPEANSKSRSSSNPMGGGTSNDVFGRFWRSTNLIMRIRKTFKGRIERTAKVKASRTICVSDTDSTTASSMKVEQSILPKSVRMSSGVYLNEMPMDMSSTARIGKVDASVMIPNPSSVCPWFWPVCASTSSRAACLAFCPLITPMPRERRMGTVTGPVVTAPQSQARPIRGASSGLPHFM
mmetsp:Transcript_1715/g.2782  ORF Transcript_1715/g.2782 Transcript_1715/m.2782 type:complete len:226 (+) Transcript_1715:635-1312(+)